MYDCMYVCMYVCHNIVLQYAKLYYLIVFFHCPAARFVPSEPEEKKEVCIGTLLATYLVIVVVHAVFAPRSRRVWWRNPRKRNTFTDVLPTPSQSRKKVSA